MAKIELKKQAIELRKQGKSINEIVKNLQVSKGSVSTWVREISLSKEQRDSLSKKHPHYKGGIENRKKFLKIRQDYQSQGRKDCKNGSKLHAIGCMLYWGEGFKKRNTCGLGNSDINLLKVFIRFLRECYGIKNSEITLYISGYPDHNVNHLEEYWLNGLELPKECLRKTQVDHRSRSSVHKGSARTLSYGLCKVVVNRTDVVQRILGSIQEYGDFTNKDWLF